MRGMCTENIRFLSQLGFEKIAFLYFYIFAFCRQNIYRIDAHILETCVQNKLGQTDI